MKTRAILLTFVTLLIAPSAQAARITNLDSAPQMVEIETAGGFTPVEIGSWKTFSVTGPLRVRYRGHISYIDYNMEYAIWPGGNFGPQRRYLKGTGSF